MDFLLLGPLEAHDDDGSVDIGGSRQRALLAALLVRADEVVSSERLIEEIWGDAAVTGPANALQAAVSRLRRSLGASGHLVRASPPGYTIDLDGASIDTRRFEQSVAEGRSLLAAGEPSAASEALRAGLELWRGPPLADLADLPFVASLAARFEELRLIATEERIEAELALGRHGQLVGELEALAAAHPYRERFRGQLMTALARSGRQAEALQTYHGTRRSLVEELGIEPGTDLRRRYEMILRQEDVPPPEPIGSASNVAAGNLPQPLTQFIGRDREVEQMLDLVGGVRLLTLTGPGGAGKTRLAIEVASRLRDTVSGGAWFVDLAPVPDPTMVASTVAASLGLRDEGGAVGPRPGSPSRLPDRLEAYLRDREIVIILDNCEHLIDEVAGVVSGMVTAGPEVHVVCTTREPLGIAGETVLSVPSLAVPSRSVDHADPDLLASFGAVQLFLDRAQAADPSFTLDASNGPPVGDICRRLDGMPLALELAAARLRAFEIGDLAGRLDDRFELLVGGDRTAQPRQQTLRNLVEWSWDLLDGDEQTVFRRLSVLAGRWGLDLAAAVCTKPGGDPAAVPGAIARLVDRSLVTPAHREGSSGYRILETLREFGREQLERSGEARAVRIRHAEYLADRAHELARQIRSPGQLQALDTLDDLYDDFRGALDWALRAGEHDLAARIAAQLGLYGQLRGKRAEAEGWTGRVMASGISGTDAALTLLWNAAITLLTRDAGGALTGVRDAWAVLREAEDDFDRAQGANIAALVELQCGNIAEARAMLTEGRGHAAAASAPHLLAYADYLEGTALFHTGAPDEAEPLFAQALQTAIRTGDVWGQEAYLGTMTVAAEVRGDYEEALALIGRARPVNQALGVPERLVRLEIRRAAMLMLTGEHEDAEATVASALARATDLGLTSDVALAHNIGGVIARRAGRLDDAQARHQSALEFYEKIDLAQGMSFALAGLGTAAELMDDPEAAIRFHQRGLEIVAGNRDPRAIALALEGLAGARAALGEGEQAARLLGAAAALRDGAGRPLPEPERVDVDRATAAAIALVGHDRFTATFAQGPGTDVHGLTGASAR